MDATDKIQRTTNSFSLQMQINPKLKRIQIILRDFTDYVVYQGCYSQADSKGFIDYQYAVLALSASFDKGKQQRKLYCYRMGDVIYHNLQETQTQQYPAYKIDKGGCITMFITVSQNGSKKQLKYQQAINLTKVRDMNEKQIYSHVVKNANMGATAYDEMEQIVKGNNQEIKQLTSKLQQSQRTIGMLKQENRQLNKTISQLKSQQQTYKIKVDSKLQQMGQQLTKVKQMNNLAVKINGFHSSSNQFQEYNATSSFIVISYEHLNLTKTPHILTSLHGTTSIWHITGISSIYNANSKNFQVYLKDLSKKQTLDYNCRLYYSVIPMEE